MLIFFNYVILMPASSLFFCLHGVCVEVVSWLGHHNRILEMGGGEQGMTYTTHVYLLAVLEAPSPSSLVRTLFLASRPPPSCCVLTGGAGVAIEVGRTGKPLKCDWPPVAF